MLPILRAIQPYLPLTGLVLAIFGVTIIVLLILHLRKAAKPAPSAAAAPPPPPPEPPSEPRKPLIAEREPSLALEDEPVRKASRSMTLGRVLNILRDRRYKVPWYALVGAPAAGKTALVSTLDLAPDRLDGGPSAVGEPGWWLFDDGVIVDVPGSLFLSDNGANKDHMWRLFLQRIRRVRARRTLNGIILTISCDDLIGISALDREGLLERGRDLHTRLRSAQQITGLRLPIYVVVSKCDKVSGFTSYWASMPGRRHSEMFGWSNPNSLDSAYRSEWISQAFASLSTDLFRGQVAATQDVPVGDLRAPGMVLFPVAFGGLEQPLQAILSMIFQSTAYHESFFLRGMWFTGALPPVRELMAASLAQRTIGDGVDAVPTLSSLPHIPPRPVLMRQLLRQKIFPERAVALPLSQSWRTDSQTVRRAKIAAAVGGVVLCGGLSWSTYELEQDLGSLQQALSVVGADMKRDSGPSDPLPMAHLGADEIENVSHSSVSGPATQVLQQAINGQLRLNAARALLDALSTIRTNNLTALFIPSSWFSSIDDDIAGFLSRGFEHVVLDAMEQQLVLRTHKLLTDPLPQPGAGTTDLSAGRPASANALIAYLAALDILDKDVQRFNNLGTPEGAGELPDLVRSLIGIDLPPEFNNYPDLLQSAMQRGGHHRFSIDRYHGVASERTSQLMWMVLNDLTERGDLADSLRQLTTALQQLQNGGQDADGGLLLSVRDQSNHLSALLDEPWWAVVANGALQANGQISTLLVRIGENSFLGPALRDRLTADIEGALRRFNSRLSSYDSSLTGPLLQRQQNGSMRVAATVTALAGSITSLFQKNFMDPVPAEVIPQVSGRLSWDDQRLDHAVTLWRDYDTYLADGLPQFPPILRPRVQAVMDRRLVNGLVWHITHAMKPLPSNDTWQGPSENTVMADIADLKQASQPLGLLITAFNETGNVVQRDDLSDAISASAFELLARVDHLLSNDTLYVPINSIQQWDGQQPVTTILFNAADDVALQQYLTYQRERAHRLTHDYAEPVLSAIGMADTGRNSLNRPLVQRWQRLFQDIEAYYKRRPGSTLVQLESFIRFGLADMRVGDCNERLSSMAPVQASGDYFLSRRADLLAQVMARCDSLNGGSGTLGNAYAQIAQQFNTSLAGRYPFADSPNGQGLRAATPTDIRAFYSTLDTLMPRIEQDIKRGTMPTVQRMQVGRFLSEMAAVRQFLAPVLDSKPGAPAGAYALDVTFRSNRGYELNGNQILTWAVQVGAQSVQDPPLAPPASDVAPQAGGSVLQWRWGEPLSVRLLWAKDSPLQPLATADGQPAIDPPATAVFAYRDPWALITLLRRHAINPGQYDAALQPQPNMALFTIPTYRPANSGPPVVGQSTPPSNGGEKTQVFVRFGLRDAQAAADAKADPATTLVLPVFPTAAPVDPQQTPGRATWAN